MKKNNLFLLLLILLCTSCEKQRSYLSYNQLNGPVKSVFVTTFEAKEVFGEVKKGDLDFYSASFNNALYEFDRVGMLTSVAQYGYGGDVDFKMVYTNSGVKQLSMKQFTSDGSLDTRTEFKYDGEILAEQIEYFKDGKIRTKYVYENDGKNITKTSCYKSEKKDICDVDTALAPNSKDNFADSSITSGDADLKLAYTVTSEYENGQLTKSVHYSAETKESHTTNYEWDNDLISKLKYDNFTAEIERDEHGFPINMKNCKRYPLEMIVSDEGKRFRYTYEYDEHNNWVKCIEFDAENNSPTQIIERQFEYYD